MKVLKVTAGGHEISFDWDPLCEYLAAMHWVRSFGEDEKRWAELFCQVDHLIGGQEASNGFINALYECCLGTKTKVASSALVAVSSRLGRNEEERARLRRQRKVGELQRRLDSREAEEREEAVMALFRMKEDAAPAIGDLIKLFDDEDPSVRARLCLVVAVIGEVGLRALPNLAHAIETDPDPGVRAGAANCIRSLIRTFRTKVEAAIPSLIKALEEDEDPQVRSDAALAIGDVGPTAAKAIPGLLRGLEEKNEDLRKSFAHALGGMGSEASVALPKLIEGLTDPDEWVRQGFVSALGRLEAVAEPAVPSLINLLRDPEPWFAHLLPVRSGKSGNSRMMQLQS